MERKFRWWGYVLFPLVITLLIPATLVYILCIAPTWLVLDTMGWPKPRWLKRMMG